MLNGMESLVHHQCSSIQQKLRQGGQDLMVGEFELGGLEKEKALKEQHSSRESTEGVKRFYKQTTCRLKTRTRPYAQAGTHPNSFYRIHHILVSKRE
jgi:hypothetical protein